MSIDLEKMSLEELKQLQKDVDKAIKGFEERKRAEAQARLDAVAKEMGFSLNDLMGGKGKKSKSTLPPKYMHPEDPTLTWTGRGRKPKWLTEALDAGKSLEDFEIQ